MIKPLKVLIVEDNEDDAAMLVRALKRGGFEPIYTRVDNAADLRAALSGSSWEIIICDHAMPQFDSFAALTIVKETGFDLPFIVVSGVIGEEVAVATMKAGAHDYLMKDKLLRLVPAIERELQEAEGRRQRRQAEEALRTSEERFRGLIENSPSAIFLKDREHRFRLVNKRFEQWYGVAEADVLGKTSYDLFPQEYADVYVSQDQEVLETGTAIERELTVPFADGTLHPVLVTKYPVFDARGHPVGVGTINSDMTARKHAEDELRRQRDMLDVTLSSIGDAVIATDTHSRITFFNRVAEGLTGWPQQDALGRPLDEVFRIVHEQTLQPADNPVARVLREGVIVGLANHTALITRQNQMIPIADSGAPIRSSSGILQGVVLVFRDITEQKQLEEVLLRARKIESVGVLAGGIAHDFNNLLTGIMGNVSLAMMLVGQEDTSGGAPHGSRKRMSARYQVNPPITHLFERGSACAADGLHRGTPYRVRKLCLAWLKCPLCLYHCRGSMACRRGRRPDRSGAPQCGAQCCPSDARRGDGPGAGGQRLAQRGRGPAPPGRTLRQNYRARPRVWHLGRDPAEYF